MSREDEKPLMMIGAIIRLRNLLLAGGALVLVGCSDAEHASSAGVQQGPSASSALVELRDLEPNEAVARLRSTGFSGPVEVRYNEGCSPGNGKGKIYRQEPPLRADVDFEAPILLYSGCFDVVFDLSAGGGINPVLDSPAERTDSSYRYNLKAYNSLEFTAVPDSGYALDSLKINGERIAIPSDLKFRISEITEAHTVELEFVEIPPQSQPSAPVSYSIKARVLFGSCTISPQGNVSVKEGADQTFSIAPSPGAITALTVNGAPAVCNQAGCTYTFKDVRADHSIEAICNN